jgi:hypothetical protein
MKYHNGVLREGVCKDCIIEPICSDLCYKSFAIIKKGMRIVNWIFNNWEPEKNSIYRKKK